MFGEVGYVYIMDVLWSGVRVQRQFNVKQKGMQKGRMKGCKVMEVEKDGMKNARPKKP